MAPMTHEIAGGGGEPDPVSEDGLICLEAMPVRAGDLQPSEIEDSAGNLRTMGSDVEDKVVAIHSTWSGLGGCYEAPEQGQVLDVMNAPKDSAEDLAHRFGKAAWHMEKYADALMGIKTRLSEFEITAQDFIDRAKQGYTETEELKTHKDEISYGETTKEVTWKEHGPAVARNEELLRRYANLLEDVSRAATTCANSIYSLHTGMCKAPVEPITADAIMNSSEPMPWGQAVEEDLSCDESVNKGTENFIKGSAEGLGSLIGRDPETGDWSVETSLQSLAGAGDFLVSTTVALSPTSYLAYALPEGHPARQFVADRHNVAATGWGSMIGWDHQAHLSGEGDWHKWREDGVATATESFFNVGSMFIPGGGAVAGGAKALGKGAKASRAARAADGADAVPSTRAADVFENPGFDTSKPGVSTTMPDTPDIDIDVDVDTPGNGQAPSTTPDAGQATPSTASSPDGAGSSARPSQSSTTTSTPERGSTPADSRVSDAARADANGGRNGGSDASSADSSAGATRGTERTSSSGTPDADVDARGAGASRSDQSPQSSESSTSKGGDSDASSGAGANRSAAGTRTPDADVDSGSSPRRAGADSDAPQSRPRSDAEDAGSPSRQDHDGDSSPESRADSPAHQRDTEVGATPRRDGDTDQPAEPASTTARDGEADTDATPRPRDADSDTQSPRDRDSDSESGTTRPRDADAESAHPRDPDADSDAARSRDGEPDATPDADGRGDAASATDGPRTPEDGPDPHRPENMDEKYADTPEAGTTRDTMERPDIAPGDKTNLVTREQALNEHGASPWKPEDRVAAREAAIPEGETTPRDFRTGAPLNEGPKTITVNGKEIPEPHYDMKFDAESKSWVAVNKGAGWGEGGKPLVDPVEFDADAGDVYDSGDAHRPGDADTHTPDEYRDPDSGNGIEHQNRGNDDKPWRRYQEQISGWNRTEDGKIPEYVVHDRAGNKVAFDGHTMRGDQEVFLEAKRGYEILHDAPGSQKAQDMQKSILNQAKRQQRALPEGAKLEWHVSSQAGATAMRNILKSKGIEGIDVRFTPES